MVNSVLVATVWYILSCWIFNKSCINQIQRLIRVGYSTTKVAWDVIIQPRSVGGLGIVDPIDKIRALLGKLVVRGLLPGNELWKNLLRERILVLSYYWTAMEEGYMLDLSIVATFQMLKEVGGQFCQWNMACLE